jgi:hypothetical protein
MRKPVCVSYFVESFFFIKRNSQYIFPLVTVLKEINRDTRYARFLHMNEFFEVKGLFIGVDVSLIWGYHGGGG